MNINLSNFIRTVIMVASTLGWHAELLAETQIVLSPTHLKTTKGRVSGQPLSVLSVQDQSGSADDWNAYKEFFSGSTGYAGVFTYQLDATAKAETITKIAMQANFKGPRGAEQRWRWQIRDFEQGRWVDLADNAHAVNWQWSTVQAEVASTSGRFINDLNRIKLRYFTKSNADNSDLDYLVLSVALSSQGESPQPQPEPVPEPTPEPQPQPEPVPEPGATPVWQPSPGTSWQIQLQGNIDTSYNVQMYDIDLFDTEQSVIDQLHAQGKTVICYFSAGSWEDWRADSQDFPESVKGRSNGWPGEVWLDIRNLDALGPVLQARLDLAVSKQCDGVDPDNVDGFTNATGFPLSYQDQITFNAWLANEAHLRGLSVGLKNDLEQIQDLVDDFDWTVNEQCFQYRECDMLLPFIRAGKAVFGIEYKGDPAVYCPEANRLGLDTLTKNLDLDAWRESCQRY
ncbi:MAG: endo alpha-1,4 polygalactosaminidase [Candidatus Thiodiazotropha sp.]